MRRISLFIFLTIVVLTVPVFAQKEVTRCDHISDTKARFENIAIRPPVNVIAYDGRTLSVVYKDSQGVYVEDYSTDKDSQVDLPKDYKGKWFWVMLDTCDKPHPYLYIVTPVTKEQFIKKK